MLSRHNKNLEKLVLYGLLVGLGAVFIFPFLWMVSTSMKTPREMIAREIQLIPDVPRPVNRSPYFDEEEFKFEEVILPAKIPEAVWQVTLPEIKKILSEQLNSWNPQMPGDDVPVNIPDFRSYERAMFRGLLATLAARISDESRETAVKTNIRMFKEKFSQEAKEYSKTLLPEAIEAGKLSILNDVRELVNEEMLQEVFDRCYRRFCLGKVRAAGADYKIQPLTAKNGWILEKGNARLQERRFYDTYFTLVSLKFDEENPELLFSYTPDESVKVDDIDRIFVGYRGDESWARIFFEVIRRGKIYRTSEIVNLHLQTWAEAELRWSRPDIRKMERQTYYVLKETNEKIGSDTPFQVRVHLIRNSYLRAWHDKILRNYWLVFREVPFLRYILTSLSLCIINIVLTIFSSTLVAYAFARLIWPGRNIFFGIMIATIMLPGQVTMIPGFLIARSLGWYNTLIPMWIYSAFGAPFFIFLLRQFFKTIPGSLEDAAKIDGCSFLGVYWHLMLPLVKPTIAIIAIFTFMGTWNNFMTPLIFVNEEYLFPLSLGLFRFDLVSGGDAGLMMAGSFIMILPLLIMFFFAQKYFIQGITLTGTKW